MTIGDLSRRAVTRLKATRPRVRICKIDELKLGYLSIPKVASSSIRDRMSDWQSQTSAARQATRASLSASQVARLRQHFTLFSFVRNPLTRLYSCYRDKVVNNERRYARCRLSPYRIHFGMSFEDFVRRVVQIPDKYADQHFRSLSSFLIHKGELMVDHVGKFEHFDEGWKVISSRFQIPAPSRSLRVSGPPVPIHELPLSAGALQLVIRRYAQDLDTFGYRNELEALAQRLARE